MKHDWTPAKIEELTRLWAQGWSCSQIANRMGGLTRNAVIGKVHRLKLASRVPRPRNSNNQLKPKPVKNLDGKVRAPVKLRDKPLPLPAERAPIRQPVSLLDLEHGMCRFPFGEVGQPGFGFCADRSVPGTSYCDEHLKVCCRPFVPRQRKPIDDLTTRIIQAQKEAAL
jgi:GcrA cell cycle regulator